MTKDLFVVYRLRDSSLSAQNDSLSRKGELTLQKFKVRDSEFNGEEKAEECFQKALTIARQYEAKSLELRAATSLA